MTDALEKLENYLEAQKHLYSTKGVKVRDQAYRRLYDALRNTDFEPGEPLPEIQLSNMLGISRTPVREALQQLASDGLIQIIQGRAITILAPSPHEVFDALYIREMLEPQAIRLCVGVISSASLKRVYQLLDVMEAAAAIADRAAWSKADREWHEVLCNACSNKLLGQMVLMARNRMYHRGADERVPERYLVQGTAEHRAIAEAIVAQDGTLAENLMRDHLRSLRENIVKRFVTQRS